MFAFSSTSSPPHLHWAYFTWSSAKDKVGKHLVWLFLNQILPFIAINDYCSPICNLHCLLLPFKSDLNEIKGSVSTCWLAYLSFIDPSQQSSTMLVIAPLPSLWHSRTTGSSYNFFHFLTPGLVAFTPNLCCDKSQQCCRAEHPLCDFKTGHVVCRGRWPMWGGGYRVMWTAVIESSWRSLWMRCKPRY